MAELSSFDPCYQSHSYPTDLVVDATATDICNNTHNREQLMPSSLELMLFIQFSIAFVNLRNITTKQQTSKQDHCPFSSSTRAFQVVCIARTYDTLSYYAEGSDNHTVSFRSSLLTLTSLCILIF